MMPAPGLQVSAAQFAILNAILREHLPDGVIVWAYGSRAKGKAKPFSDLDLALECDQPLPPGLFGALADAFDDSDLPWKVDMIDWHAATPAFRALIVADRIALDLR
ncbi:nucleotidyltransferase domain-containing protein [Novosphingobium sp.]|uniref:nucleotidyltransferase domain-containing protein n=1 Tax=Novosphingobium sp. TaxID=1874826 RepID=UPI00333EF3C9